MLESMRLQDAEHVSVLPQDALPAATAADPVPLARAAALGLAYFTAALLSLYVSRQPGSIATIWYATAVAVPVLAFAPWREAPLLVASICIADTAANVLWGDGLLHAWRFLPANVAEALAGAWLVRRSGLVERGVRRSSQLLLLLILGGLLPQAIGATLGAVALHGADPRAYARTWLAWAEGSVVGALSLLPLAFKLASRPWSHLRRLLLNVPVLAHSLIGVGTAVFSLAYLPYPFVYVTIPLMFAALALPLVGAMFVTLAVSIAIAVMLALGLFVPTPIALAWQHVLVYLAFAVTLVPAQVLAAALAELRDKHASLERHRRDLQHANDGLENFVRIASHDLREPLNTVVQFASLVESDHGARLPEDARLYLRLVRTGGERMRTLLDDVLQYARTQRGMTQPAEPVSLDGVIDQLRDALAARIASSKAELIVTPLPVVMGQASLLSLLFQNLLGNALKFVPPGRSPRIRISARVSDGQAWITVADNGIGIAQADIGRLFQPFQRLQRRRDYEGTGLGLLLCRQIARAHGGDVTLRSVVGEGSEFVVRLPAAHPPEGAV